MTLLWECLSTFKFTEIARFRQWCNTLKGGLSVRDGIPSERESKLWRNVLREGALKGGFLRLSGRGLLHRVMRVGAQAGRTEGQSLGPGVSGEGGQLLAVMRDLHAGGVTKFHHQFLLRAERAG